MKKVLIGTLLLCGSIAFTQRSDAQVRVGINVNIGQQPAWRVPGYDYVEYYYLPDIDAYYSVPRRQFIYLSNGRWVFSTSLPYQYRHYDLYHTRRIVINRPNAYMYYSEHRIKYGKKPKYDRGNHYGRGKGKGKGRY
jgi:hypothetical protein